MKRLTILLLLAVFTGPDSRVSAGDVALPLDASFDFVLTVTDAPEGVRGDSANNVQKAVTIETGITVQAPLFIKTGEKIKIDTRTGKYMERA